MELALQLFVVGLSQAAVYALVATGFGLILAVTHVFHFAHAAVFALCGFLAYALTEQLGLPFLLALPIVTLLTILSGLAVYEVAYRPLLRRSAGTGTFTIILASIGVQFTLENILALIWGSGGRYLPNPISGPTFTLGPILITLTDLVIIGSAIVLFMATLAFMRFTPFGRAMMAYADNPTMARIVGINSVSVASAAIVIASILIVPAAVATGWYSSLLPSMGMHPLLYAVAAVVVGGIGSFSGAFIGAFGLGLLSAMLSYVLPAFWSDSIALMAMMLFVIFLPTGLFGKALKGTSVR